MISSDNTSIKQLPVIVRKIAKIGGWIPKSLNWDIGCGKYPQIMTDYLYDNYGVVNLPYDPHNQDEDTNSSTMILVRRFMVDSVTISNVLNVILERVIRINLLEKAKRYCSGKVYITVYEGNRSGMSISVKKDSWQNNRILKSYLPEVKEVFDDVIIKHNMIIAED